MTVTQLLDQFQGDLWRSLEIFVPELILSVTVVLLLLSRLCNFDRLLPACWVALLGALAAFLAVFAQFAYVRTGGAMGGLHFLSTIFGLTETGVGASGPYFTGLMMHDALAVFFRLGLMLFLVLTMSLTVLTGIPDQEDGPDFYALLVGSSVGMLLATGANHLLMAFLSIEMISVPSYAMVGFLKGRRQASEAALKYVVYGAGTAGVMLYGLSLLGGLLGTADFSLFGERFGIVMEGQTFTLSNPTVIVALLGIAMVFVGIAFKLSLVPFHFWCPDAFEGASAEVAGFLSVASKAAVFALLARFVTSFSGGTEAVRQLSTYLGLSLGVIAAFSMTLGNLSAYTQTNLKRLLAYSTIAHAGYMVMAVAALMVLSNAGSTALGAGSDLKLESQVAVEGLVYYLSVYLFMNLTAFAVIAFLRNETFREDIDSVDGLIAEGPATKVLCIALMFSFFSLVGIPPFGGFFAKFAIFRSTFVAGQIHPLMWGVLAIAGLNTVISLFYYVRVLKAVFINPRPIGERRIATPAAAAAFTVLLAVPIIILGASPIQGRLSETARTVAGSLLSPTKSEKPQ
ncbi:NADH-quinone oxidoreductase subunit N [Caulifigura coniformis]|uniref:NADH-quinone oxidoreductase subunit N n=1 Tax=Caulifigura coniformis TaxID=2527983 RepID=A0A517SH69_9PLAN|nr:NADH-quinone oxidoreductase subunit N [Caulifigura coniformis]QDT55437.1 NADH-quinone oxidoreductase subunit N [Caulifigura coniformis]